MGAKQGTQRRKKTGLGKGSAVGGRMRNNRPDSFCPFYPNSYMTGGSEVRTRGLREAQDPVEGRVSI